MEKITCEVIRDLLPLYIDEVCSPDSRSLVEDHLRTCEDCRRLLEKMGEDCRISGEAAQQEETVIKNMAAGWKKSVRKNFLKGAVLAVAMVLLLAGAFWGLSHWPLSAVPVDVVRAEAVYDGDKMINVYVEVTDGKNVRYSETRLDDDGNAYLILKRGVIALDYGGQQNWTAQFGISTHGMADSGAEVQMKALYLGDSEDKVLLWAADD